MLSYFFSSLREPIKTRHTQLLLGTTWQLKYSKKFVTKTQPKPPALSLIRYRTLVQSYQCRYCNRFIPVSVVQQRPAIDLLALALREASRGAQVKRQMSKGKREPKDRRSTKYILKLSVCRSLLVSCQPEDGLYIQEILKASVIRYPAITIITSECTIHRNSLILLEYQRQ